MRVSTNIASAAALIAASFLIGGCQSGDVVSAETSGVSKITATTSFGMCVGYCTTMLEIRKGEVVLTRIGRGGRGAAQALPDQVARRTLDTAEWNDLVSLAANARFEGLPAVVGCPDCADGGAESLSVESANGTRSVKFEFGAEVEGIQPLLDRVRKEREKLTPAE
jgi:hypothetical protein